MTLRALGVAAILLAFTTSAHAGGVDWSDYIEKPGDSRKLANTSPQWRSEPAAKTASTAKTAKTAKTTKAKRTARPAKAKASKTKAKTRGKAKRRR